MKKNIIYQGLLLLLLLVAGMPVKASEPLKREFRGAWIQAVNGQFIGMSTSQMQQTLTAQLDALQRAGINAIIFQVRPEADALYMSYYEPWSRYLTGEQGLAPDPYWDPLQWMIDESHKRGMELHAWINPYRARTKGTKSLGMKHPYKSNPERFIEYDGMLIFNPALQENRDYICTIVTDIVKRYDVDGLHIDDYFYPYPVSGASFDDAAQYESYIGDLSKDDWRRENINQMVKGCYEAIKAIRPECKFGISPFGIWQNDNGSNGGSDTSGFEELSSDDELPF